MIDYGNGMIFPDTWGQGPPDPPDEPEPEEIEHGSFVPVSDFELHRRCPCGHADAEPGAIFCEVCRERNQEAAAELAAERRA